MASSARASATPAMESIRIHTKDDHQFDLLVFPGSGEGPVFLCMPAMGVRASYYKILAAELAQAGFDTAVAELRGLGSSSVRASRSVDFGYAEMITQDWPAALDAVEARFPGRPCYFLGHSLGGQLSALFLAANPKRGAGLVLVASVNVYYRGWPVPARYGLWLGTQIAPWVAWVLGRFPGKQLGFGGNEARTVIKDWARNARRGDYRCTGLDLDLEALAAERAMPILALTLAADRFAPCRPCKNLYGKFKAAEVVHYHHHDSKSADGLVLDHFSWAKQPEWVIGMIQEWVSQLG